MLRSEADASQPTASPPVSTERSGATASLEPPWEPAVHAEPAVNAKPAVHAEPHAEAGPEAHLEAAQSSHEALLSQAPDAVENDGKTAASDGCIRVTLQQLHVEAASSEHR